MKTNIPSQILLRQTLLLLALLLAPLNVTAQTTIFTYQGKLADTGAPANGSYDFQFKMFDALTGGSAIASAALNGVTVTNGVFTVNLDFGVCPGCFDGANRFLAISVKPTSGSTFTDLNPRQQVTSAPYAIKSQSAASADGLSVACVNCVTSGQIGSVSGSAITGTIPVSSLPAGSANYIQNTVSQQSTSNFNISGNGTAAGTLSGNVVNAAAQFNIAGGRVLSNPGSFNLFAGVNAGDGNTSGSSNSFFGALAGNNNTTASDNSFFGAGTGALSTGQQNSFFGSHAGQSNTMASFNSFFGAFAGDGNMAGASNSFFGASAGVLNTTGGSNSFFGASAGAANISGGNGSFFGFSAGLSNTSGARNSFFGTNAGKGNMSGSDNSFFGYEAGLNNTALGNSFFGKSAGAANTGGGNNAFFGFESGFKNIGLGNSFFGSQAGFNNTTGGGNSFFGASAGGSTDSGGSNSFFGTDAGFHNFTGKRNVMIGDHSDFRNAQATSTGAVAGDENLFVGYQASGAFSRRNAAAIGTNAFVACDDCMVLGTTGGKVGIGMTTPQQSLSVEGGLVIDQANLGDGTLPPGTNKALTFGSGSGEGIVSKRTAGGNQFGMDFYTNFLNRMSITNNGDVGIGTTTPAARLWVDGDTHITGKLTVSTLSAAAAIHVCSNAIFELSTCSSSIRYKTNVVPLTSGLELLRQLRPVTFDWKTTGQRDLGLIAEEVETVEPLLVTRNNTGQIEGVKYDQLSVVLINAINEQQSQIKQQQTRLRTQQVQIDKQLVEIENQQSQIKSLLKLVCLDHPGADICRKP